MSVKNDYKVRFTGLKDGKHQFEFEVGKKFFEDFEYSDVSNGDIKVFVDMEKQSTMLVLWTEVNGWVELMCDICTDNYQQDISNKERLIVKFNDDDFSDSEDIIALTPSEYEVNLTPFIYEYIITALPSKRKHDEGECNKEMINTINKYTVEESEEDNNDIDPRWDDLKNLID